MLIGLDIGTTSISAVALDPASGRQLAHHTVANRAGSSPAPGLAELDIAQLFDLTVQCLAGLVAQAALPPSAIQGIGVTGQQHGVALMRPDAIPAAPAITWQDLRVQQSLPGTDTPVLERFIAAAGGRDAFRNTGCLPAAGFLGPSLYWLTLQDALPDPPVTACFVPDAVVSFLTGAPLVSEPTLAASSGIFDIRANQWEWTLLERLKLPARLFPPVGRAGDVMGGLRRELAEAVGLTPGTAVTIALGDNQASFIGSAPGAGPQPPSQCRNRRPDLRAHRQISYYSRSGEPPLPRWTVSADRRRPVRRSFLRLFATFFPAGRLSVPGCGNAGRPVHPHDGAGDECPRRQ